MMENNEYIIEYVLVSRGEEILRTRDRDEARQVMLEMNKQYYKYAEMCMKNNMPYTDNEVHMCEEEIRGKGLRYVKPADIMKA